MKKVLIANKFYYNRGGDCIASIALEKLLKSKGHDVAFFSMQYEKNFESEWSPYFPSEVDFQSPGLAGKLKAFERIFRSGEVERKFSLLLERFRPDVVHLNNIHSYLSPVIGEIAHKKGVKVVWSLHDHKLVCPAYLCLRGGHPCTLCVKGNVSNVLLKKCMKNSLPASLAAFLEALYWNRPRLARNTDHFIVPSRFLADMMAKGGFPPSQIKVLPNYVNHDLPAGIAGKGDYYLYVGRLSEEKGVHTLLEAARSLPYELQIAGDGPLRGLLSENMPNVRYLGFKSWDELSPIVRKAKFVVMPSECYENNPLAVIESLCLGTPVLGADIGGIPETIMPEQQNGMLFKSGDKMDLQDKIKTMFERSFNYQEIADEARERFSADKYYNEIIKIYEQ